MNTFEEIPAAPVPTFQNVGELGELWNLVAAGPHETVLEIGSLYGGTLHYWSRLPHVRTLISVDLLTESGRIVEAVRAARADWPLWIPPNVHFHAIEADSHLAETVHHVSTILVAGPGTPPPYDPSPIDFLFVDGDHSYEGVRADWILYRPLVRPGGIVAFHDTWPNPDRHLPEPGVERFVEELRHELPAITFTNPDGVGITAFRVPS